MLNLGFIELNFCSQGRPISTFLVLLGQRSIEVCKLARSSSFILLGTAERRGSQGGQIGVGGNDAHRWQGLPTFSWTLPEFKRQSPAADWVQKALSFDPSASVQPASTWRSIPIQSHKPFRWEVALRDSPDPHPPTAMRTIWQLQRLPRIHVFSFYLFRRRRQASWR